MTKENDDALRCADEAEKPYWSDGSQHLQLVEAAAHIRRLVAENEAMRCERDANLDTINVDNAIITRLKAENESATALVQQMLEALERMDGWLKVRHMGGLMPEERALTTAAREWLEGKK